MLSRINLKIICIIIALTVFASNSIPLALAQTGVTPTIYCMGGAGQPPCDPINPTTIIPTTNQLTPIPTTVPSLAASNVEPCNTIQTTIQKQRDHRGGGFVSAFFEFFFNLLLLLLKFTLFPIPTNTTIPVIYPTPTIIPPSIIPTQPIQPTQQPVNPTPCPSVPVATPTVAPTIGGSNPTATPAPIAKCTTDLTSDLTTLGVPGLSAAIVKNGNVVCTAVAGVANTTQNKPVTSDTVFLWASVSKTVIVTAAMQLYEQGKFKLDDDISTYLGYKVENPSCPSTPITFRQLMTHTSSIVDDMDFLDSLTQQGADSNISLADYFRGYLVTGGTYYKTQNFGTTCPGTKYEYSNNASSLLGHLVEKISGEDYSQYAINHIFTPLGMTNSSFRLADLNQSMIALPSGNKQHYGLAPYAAGTLRSTPTQLGKFVAMYIQGGQYNNQQILKPATIQELIQPQTTLDETQGFMWLKYATIIEGTALWGHTGASEGAEAEIFFDPISKIGILLVRNGNMTSDNPISVLQKLYNEGKNY